MAIAGIVLLVIVGALHLVSKYPDLQFWLTLIGAILIGLEAARLWRGGGYYRGRGV